MIPFRWTIWRFGILSGLLLITAACSNEKHNASGGGVESSKLHAQFDRDSRNNENDTLGVKSKWLNDQQGKTKAANPGSFQQLDMTNSHLTKAFRFSPEMAKPLERNQGVQAVTVMLTETNAYVAVVMNGHDLNAESHPDMMANQVTSKGGIGLFGTDKGNARINWGDTGGLSMTMSSQIKSQVLAMSPPNIQRVFVSANPNFVQRIRFYEKEELRGVDLSAYLNEFNTMVQRVFPNDHNTRK
ncbi:hypothetical protein GC093_11260 [Paenibacillus sp. LMG 31456]|uniref:Sporulation protein n=1 Tax=Paenibacillus foliorum TaxID=2654974 RepID=A0A972GTZ5_9BACL|nr:hypothetical protein [Paenibacillus foliorum]